MVDLNPTFICAYSKIWGESVMISASLSNTKFLNQIYINKKCENPN